MSTVPMMIDGRDGSVRQLVSSGPLAAEGREGDDLAVASRIPKPHSERVQLVTFVTFRIDGLFQARHDGLGLLARLVDDDATIYDIRKPARLQQGLRPLLECTAQREQPERDDGRLSKTRREVDLVGPLALGEVLEEAPLPPERPVPGESAEPCLKKALLRRGGGHPVWSGGGHACEM
jgi:hypothetical protein